MSNPPLEERRHHGWCPLCRSRCGCISTVRDGRLVSVEPDPDHPTGAAICAKGRAAPELVHSPERVLYPLRRTRPKGDPDPGWERISWEKALDQAAEGMRHLAAEGGPESVAFAITTPSGTSMSDGQPFVERLMNGFGSPNNCYATEICNWHKDVAFEYTFGAGIGSPDFERAGCVVLWGHNPNVAWLAQGSRTAAARRRGARLVVIDPRRAGPAAKADWWLRVRPGSDGALALAMAGVMISAGAFDRDFLRAWSNGPFLVREDDGRLLDAAEIGTGPDGHAVVWDEGSGRAVAVDPAAPVDPQAASGWRLEGTVEISGPAGPVPCRTAFEAYAALCREHPPERAETITGVPAQAIRESALALWQSRPVALYAWSGVGQHTNATQTARAISLLYALTGSYGAPGGNVAFERIPMADLTGQELASPELRQRTLGLDVRPLGPPRDGWVTADDLYRAVLEGHPYPVRGLIAFGTNLLVSHADAARGARALAALDLYVHADLFVNPSAAYADLLLPVCSGWERHALRAGFEINQGANELVQYRAPAIEPLGESRSDEWIAFELARRLGLADRFWDGDPEAAYRAMLAPSGIDLEALRASPKGVRVPLETRYHPHVAAGGFATPSRRVEVWSEVFRRHDQSPLPEYVEPAMSPVRRPDLAGRYPLVLTSAKSHAFCHSQHRNLPSLRKLARAPEIEIHPDAARARGIGAGDPVTVETPAGAFLANARLRPDLDPTVVAAQHGWWQGCTALDLPAYPAFGEGTANFNSAIAEDEVDPISGSVALRSYLCEVRRCLREPIGS